ncbi:hypothetical protein [Mucilaginibacter straminoryzae]|uniref:hypothetical protein n=1 Tax=Mucilaginibacter straminoryzae TaxID=2932774 RepID=UPI001FD70044|nr:hypothetical protein [Mucilaginibacter straminoryzae]
MFCLLFSSFNYNAEPDYAVIRKQLLNALNSKQTTDSLYNVLTASKNKTPVIVGYIGALEALKAKYTWNPYFKLKYLNTAEDHFEKAVAQDPDNIEIRFMRFSVEHHVPSFLGYNKNLQADKHVIINQIERNNYHAADKALVVTVMKFLIDSDRCTAGEKELLNKHLSALK